MKLALSKNRWELVEPSCSFGRITFQRVLHAFPKSSDRSNSHYSQWHLLGNTPCLSVPSPLPLPPLPGIPPDQLRALKTFSQCLCLGEPNLRSKPSSRPLSPPMQNRLSPSCLDCSVAPHIVGCKCLVLTADSWNSCTPSLTRGSFFH